MAGTDFLSSLFQGIGDTFKAGAAVNQAQISERIAKGQVQLTREELAAMSDADRLAYLAAQAKQENNLILIIVIAAIVFAIVLIYIHRK